MTTVPIKCVLLGETAVGKTSFINRFVNDTFTSEFVPTMIGCYSSKEVFYEKANRKIKYELWDTAGQEKYRSINKIFYQDTLIVILIFDITRKDTFSSIKDYWYQEVKENSPDDVIIAIAANKSDLYEKEEVSQDEVEEFAESINAIYKQTSALNGSGIKEIFESIGDELTSSENFDNLVRKSSATAIRLDSTSVYNVTTEKTGSTNNCCV